MSPRTVPLFGSRLRACPYLPGREERNVIAELNGPDPQGLYEAAVQAGFRRSHDIIYRPACPGCDACIPIRVAIGRFRPRRSLARVWRRNAALAATVAPPRATLEQYALFSSYQTRRHPGGGMDGMGFHEFRELMESSPVGTFSVEFRDAQDGLQAVMLADEAGDGLSAVYSFFDPDDATRGLGTFMVLWLIEHARARNLPHVYLGYWIEGSAKMSYKGRFRPLEALGPAGWGPFEPECRTIGTESP